MDKDNSEAKRIAQATIPPEAVEAAARAMKEAVGAECLDASEERAYRLMALAALRAGIAAWPGMAYRYRMSVSLDPQEIILPLTESTND